MPDELRAQEYDAFSIEIKSQLDGPLESFGKRAWKILSNKIGSLGQRLNGSEPLIDVNYTDRYLYSPIMIMLLWRLLGALEGYSGGIDEDTRIVIRTGKVARKSSYEPRFIYHDWREAGDRREVLVSLLSPAGQLNYKEMDRYMLPHARELCLTWDKGIVWKIRLDQGVGYWHAARDGERFPFDQSPERQVEFMEKLNINILAGSKKHSTCLYLTFSN